MSEKWKYASLLIKYDYLSNSNCSWHCTKCDSINYSLGSVSDLSSFASVNSLMLCTRLTKAFSLLHHQLPQKDSLQRPHPLPCLANKIQKLSSFKSNENIHKREDGSYYVVSANKASSVTL